MKKKKSRDIIYLSKKKRIRTRFFFSIGSNFFEKFFTENECVSTLWRLLDAKTTRISSSKSFFKHSNTVFRQYFDSEFWKTTGTYWKKKLMENTFLFPTDISWTSENEKMKVSKTVETLPTLHPMRWKWATCFWSSKNHFGNIN